MSNIKIRTVDTPIIFKVISSQPVVARIASQQEIAVKILGKPGPPGVGLPGPDPWLDPIQTFDASGDLVINYALGKTVRMTLIGDVTSLSISNWPVSNRIARLTLEILNSGTFDILAWPAETYWQFGAPPVLTKEAGSRDRIILSTTNAGAVIYGDPVGFDYRKP